MTKFVSHPYGLVVSSDNEFFVIDRAYDTHDGGPELVLPPNISNLRDGYKSTVSFDNYKLDNYTALNKDIVNPAIQLIWDQERVSWISHWVHDGKTYDLPNYKEFNILKPWVEKWLTDNIGNKYDMWDTYSRSMRHTRTVFFKRRKDSISLVKMIKSQLLGIKYKL